MFGRSQRAEIRVLGLLLVVACQSAPPSDMNPSGVNMQSPNGQSGATGGAATSGAVTGNSGNGTAPVGGRTAAGTTGNSGTNPNGSAGTTPSGASGTGSPGTNDPRDVGSKFVSGSWEGYVWTAVMGTGSTITPMDFGSQTTGMPRCVKGSVAATTDYSGIAILGFNLNEGPTSPAMGVKPTKTGVMVDVKNNANSPLRFQVKSTAGGMETTWCATLTGSGGFIPWSKLNTKCWDGTGKAYNSEPLTAAMVLVPGATMAAVAFDFCVNSLVETDGPVGGGTAGTSSATGGTGAAGMGSPTAGNMSTGGMGGSTKFPRLSGGCDGWASRYWDCCKPHCGWSDKVQGGTSPLTTCDRSDNNTGADAANACEGGSAYLCHSMSPWAADNQLAFGYAAVPARGDICGKCYQLDFNGSSHNGGNDPGAAALGGKTMIVQAINIGADVGTNQFDIAIPGGGVGAYNACSTQWGATSSQLGATYGGFLATCKGQSSDHQAIKSCVMQKCQSVFEAKGLSELMAACKWYVEWFQAADNPSLKYAEVACPSELTGKGLRRNGAPASGCLR